jgi:ribonucleoside-diphosphate reductase alpha chain
MSSTPESVPSPFLAPISKEIWDMKYRFAGNAEVGAETSPSDTFRRVAVAASAVERGGKRQRDLWASRFLGAMSDYGFLPAGRILAGAGTGRSVTLFNCFVMGRIDDDLSAIFDHVKEAALTLQAGGGIGHDFSTLRPRGAVVRSIGADASGPVSFMDVWDAMCRTIMSAGSRRGAMMATLRCDHPDIEEFVRAKADPTRLRNFNLSVLITDAFMTAVRDGRLWNLVFDGKVYRSIDARALWDQIMQGAYDYAEPGVIFIDRINTLNNLSYCETIATTNPCGEQPLPPYGACLLGSINLAQLVDRPFAAGASIDTAKLEARVVSAVRLLDNVIDISNYPLAAQRDEAKSKRRIGLGVTGLADALIFSGLRYGSSEAVTQASQWMHLIQRSAYMASIELAREKGAFPLCNNEALATAPNVATLGPDVQAAVRKHGLRNGCLTSIAPTGTISLFAGNVSSGIEPVFDAVYSRRVRNDDNSYRTETVEDFAHATFRKLFGDETMLPKSFVCATDLSPADHLAMQAAVQPFVDSAISKTVNCPETLAFDSFKDLYSQAFALGLKGCTAYRPNPVTGAILTSAGPTPVPVSVAEPVAAAVPMPTPIHATMTASDTTDWEPALATPEARSLPTNASADVVYMTKPLERAPVLQGATYKLKWASSDHALYITINDMIYEVQTPGGGVTTRQRPFEIFINSRNLEHYAWTVALTRMISAVFRRGGDVSFVADELKAIFDPQGGAWVDGKYVPSLLAAIGDVIETHMIRSGFMAATVAVEDSVGQRETATNYGDGTAGETGATPYSLSRTNKSDRSRTRSCPRCGAGQYRLEGRCWTCQSCGFSRCD